jgi:hypothetical protein
MVNALAVACVSLGMASRSPTTKPLADKILIAFHQACDQQSYPVAWELLLVLEIVAMRVSFISADARRIQQSLVAAHERLWLLRNPTPKDGN